MDRHFFERIARGIYAFLWASAIVYMTLLALGVTGR
jgi:hypothetical protein